MGKRSLQSSLKKISYVLMKVKHNREMMKVLEDLLTPQEILAIAERIDVVKALLHNLPQREISRKLGTSIAKITRGSQMIQYGRGGLKKLL